MNVGMVGLGKLGMPVACAMAARGLKVYGYDIRPEARRFPEDTSHEQGLASTVEQARGNLHFVGLTELALESEVVFVAVETPHQPRFEGVTPLPDERADFDYTSLKQAVADIVRAAESVERKPTIAVISTVLPGTMEREIVPLLDGCPLVYNPSFIAMGTTIRDFLDPEFVLLGGDDEDRVGDVYDAILPPSASFYRTSVENAELIKVAYNTFIGLKIAFANTLMEVCHKTGCDVDEVTGALKLAHRRLISGAYMDGGMGDGGGCHPRDNIALSWLARELNLSHDLFEDAMVARQDHAAWLAEWLWQVAVEHDLPIGILGVAYKPGSHITTGSPALLVKSLLEPAKLPVHVYDPHAGPLESVFDAPHVYLVGCKHPQFAHMKLPAGSVVIDPFRYIPDQEGVEVVRVGEGKGARPPALRNELPSLAA